MRTNKINMCLLFFVIILSFIIFGVHYRENFDNNNKDNKDDDIEKHKEVKLNNKNYNIENKNVENFHNSYHGGLNPGFPFTTSNVPNAQSQNRQFLKNSTFNYPSIYDDPYRYPNVTLPPTVIGCGSRRGACMGGSQVPIPNTLPPVNISEENIAPINLTVRGFDEGIQQVGTIQKVFGKDNLVYPLFGRKRYRNDNKWEYFVKFGDYGVILPIVPLRNYEELNTNDKVYIQGQKGEYRVTMYDEDIPQFLPFS